MLAGRGGDSILARARWWRLAPRHLHTTAPKYLPPPPKGNSQALLAHLFCKMTAGKGQVYG